MHMGPLFTTIPGFIIVFAKISDVFGRKSMLLITTVTFAIFSGACGAAQSMDQLLVTLHGTHSFVLLPTYSAIC